MSLLRKSLAEKGLDKKKLEQSSKSEGMTEARADVLLKNKTTAGVDRVQHERPLSKLLGHAQTMKTDSKPTVEAEVKPVTKSGNAILDKIKARKQEQTAEVVETPAEDKVVPEPEQPKKLSPLDRIKAKKQEAKPEPELKEEFKVETKSLRQPILKPVEAKEKTAPLSPLERIKAKKRAEAAEKARTENKQGAVDNALAQINAKSEAPEAVTERIEAMPKKPAPKLIASGDPKLSPLERLKAKNAPKPAPEPEAKPSKLQSLLNKAKAKKEEDSKPTHPEHDTAAEVIKAGSAMPKIEIVQKEDSAPQEAASQVLEGQHIPADNRAIVELNEKQRHAVNEALSGQDLCMVGPAGTGKTTGVRGILRALRDAGKIEKRTEFKRYGGQSTADRVGEQWSVACVAFTRTAANNLRASITADPDLEDFYYSCQTIHNLLEYVPEQMEVWDEEEGCYKETMRFVPTRDAGNKIDVDIVLIEEGSMVDLPLAAKLLDALPSHCQIVYLGDINQLPPVFGLPILAYALHKLPVVELTHVYRQAIGPILNAAHAVLEGRMPVEERADSGIFNLYHDFKTDKGGNSIKSHSKDTGTPVLLGQENCANIYSKMFEMFYKKEAYNPETDMILTPWNKRELGTTNLNYMIAQFIGDSRKAVVHEIIAGFAKHYLAEGDRVMVDKQPGTVKSIGYNTDYMGRAPAPAGYSLSRFGVRILGREDHHDVDLDEMDDYGSLDLDKLTEATADEVKRAASHVVTVELETGEEVSLSNAGDFSHDRFSLGYVLTTHKAQGMEFKRVWIIAHREQATTITREWLYTAITRAKEECTVIGHEATLDSALKRQRIKGNTLEEKIEAFTGAVDNLVEIDVVPEQ